MILFDYQCGVCGLAFEAYAVDGGEMRCTCGGVAEKQLGGKPAKAPGRSEARERGRVGWGYATAEIMRHYDRGETRVVDEFCLGDDHEGNHEHLQLRETELVPKAKA